MSTEAIVAQTITAGLMTLLGVAAGYRGTLRTDERREQMVEHRERTKRQEEFQRETLRELQDMLLEWNLALNLVYIDKTHEAEETGSWQPGTKLGEPAERMFKLSNRALDLASRLPDESLTTAIREAYSAQVRASKAESFDASWSHVTEAASGIKEARVRAGDILRRLYFQS